MRAAACLAQTTAQVYFARARGDGGKTGHIGTALSYEITLPPVIRGGCFVVCCVGAGKSLKQSQVSEGVRTRVSLLDNHIIIIRAGLGVGPDRVLPVTALTSVTLLRKSFHASGERGCRTQRCHV